MSDLPTGTLTTEEKNDLLDAHPGLCPFTAFERLGESLWRVAPHLVAREDDLPLFADPSDAD